MQHLCSSAPARTSSSVATVATSSSAPKTYSSAVGSATSKLGCNDQLSDESDDGVITVPKKKGGVKTTKTSCVQYGGGPSLSSESSNDEFL